MISQQSVCREPERCEGLKWGIGGGSRFESVSGCDDRERKFETAALPNQDANCVFACRS